MPLSVQCPGCRNVYSVAEQMAGQGVQCQCGTQFVVPHPAAPPPGMQPGYPQQFAGGAAGYPQAQGYPQSPGYPQTPGYPQASGYPQTGYGQQPAGYPFPGAAPAAPSSPWDDFGGQMAAAAARTPAAGPSIVTAGLWRAGSLLVMQPDAGLPCELCIKTGAPATQRLTVKVTYVPAWVYLTMLAGRIVYWAMVNALLPATNAFPSPSTAIPLL